MNSTGASVSTSVRSFSGGSASSATTSPGRVTACTAARRRSGPSVQYAQY
ncbi:hypothetical protein [Microbispora bryophytorum]